MSNGVKIKILYKEVHYKRHNIDRYEYWISKSFDLHQFGTGPITKVSIIGIS